MRRFIGFYRSRRPAKHIFIGFKGSSQPAQRARGKTNCKILAQEKKMVRYVLNVF
jgi:hypothetical protein